MISFVHAHKSYKMASNSEVVPGVSRFHFVTAVKGMNFLCRRGPALSQMHSFHTRSEASA